jgi:hypothetical protein
MFYRQKQAQSKSSHPAPVKSRQDDQQLKDTASKTLGVARPGESKGQEATRETLPTPASKLD